MLYNLDHGGREGNNLYARWPALIKTIKSINPDIAVLLECWNWKEKKQFKKFVKKLSYPYYYFSPSNTKHHIGLIAKIKPAKIKKYRENFHHSVLQAHFNQPLDFNILGIHLSPTTENIRLKEAGRIIKLAKTNRPAIIIGDFNSLSPLDGYNERKLIGQFQKNNISKFGKNKLEKRVIAKMLKSGLIDIYKAQHQGKKLYYSVPSQCCQDRDHAAKMRLDYAFIDKSLIKTVTASKIIKNRLTNKSSDHYPLLLELK